VSGLRGRVGVVRRRLDSLPVLVIDAGVAVVCYLATVAVPVKAASSTGWSLFVLAAVASVPLAWRRRSPVLVAAVVGAGTIGLAVTGAQNFIPLPYGQLVATYTVAALCPPLWRTLVMLATGVGVGLVLVEVLGAAPSIVATAVVPFVVAYAMGTGARARRDRIAMLEERAGRLVEERETAAVRERERIAREIHDIVAHSVSLMVVQAESGAVHAPDRERATFDTISATGRQAVAQLDRALGVLRADGPARHPLPGIADLPDLVAQSRSADLAAELVVQGQPRLVPAELGAAVYRVAQEALTNTIKHAAASRVTVELAWRGTELLVQVIDDGRGATVAGPAGGRGLVGMRERVRAFGGTLETGPADETGFRVSARIPLQEPRDG
jgi:signal transduction histidine kinase